MEPTADLSSLDAAPRSPLVDVVVPVHNEAHVIEERIATLHGYLGDHFPFRWRITIADNGSTDGTAERAAVLALELPGVHTFHIDAAGRGRAVRAAWTRSPADVMVYMDVDLSTAPRGDLACLQPVAASRPEPQGPRRAVRLQGDPSRGRGADPPRRTGRQLVLRYRAPRLRAPRGPPDHRDAHAMDRRPRFPSRDPADGDR